MVLLESANSLGININALEETLSVGSTLSGSLKAGLSWPRSLIKILWMVSLRGSTFYPNKGKHAAEKGNVSRQIQAISKEWS